MSTARKGRRVAILALVVGISLVSGIATVWQLAEPRGGSAVHTAALPTQDDPGQEVAADEDTPQSLPAPMVTPQAGGPASWVSRGRPSRMVTVRPTSLDLIVDGRVSSRVAFGGTSVTLAELDRYLPASWLTISDGTATLSATVVLTRGTTFDVAGGDLRTLQLAGGATAADAASIHTGGAPSRSPVWP
jgi:hypothetical protein